MDALEEFKQTFFQECDELLGELETHLMALQGEAAEVETLHAAFRAIHSIKGGAGAFGFDRLVSFSHTFETVLDLMREGKVAQSEDIVATIVRAGDIVADLVTAAREGDEPDEDFGADVLAALVVIAGEDAPAGNGNDDADVSDLDDFDFTPIRIDEEPATAEAEQSESAEDVAPTTRRYRIGFRPTKTMFTRAHEPLIFVRELKSLGALTTEADITDLPDFTDLDPQAAYIRWAFELSTAADPSAIEEVFEFVIDDCELTIEPLDAERPTIEPPPPKVEPPPPSAPPRPPEETLDIPEVPDEPTPPTVDADTPTPDPASQTEPSRKQESAKGETGAGTKEPEKSGRDRSGSTQQSRTTGVTAIRVDLDKIDRLVNMVGELVITQAMISQQSDPALAEGYPQLVQGLEQLQQHTRGLQDNVMAIRAQPVSSVFSRMPRLVRELAAQTGKKIRLEMSGEGTEIDKTVIEQLNDPLTHMIRNAADHGLEAPEVREAAGKPSEGTIHLSAAQRGGRIVIEIADDGAGVNRERVRTKAIEKGLIAADAKLTDEEIDNLIFLPGFSTADQVSNLSGRGVGMDVVRQNIQKLGGRVAVRSTPGKGSSMTMTLPLTLAVLDGMIVRVGEDNYVLPLTNIIESLSPRQEDFESVSTSCDMLRIRGEYVEVISLRRAFNIGAQDDIPLDLIVVVEIEGGEQVGLVVDEIVGQQQVVIKSLEDNIDPIPGIAGATILGNGNVSLILDAGGLRHMPKHRLDTDRRRPLQTDRGQEHAA